MPAELPTVIVSDPDPTSQKQLVALLQEGFRCVVTKTLQETYQALLMEQPILLIVELDQLDGDGMSLIRYLQAHPVFRQVLVACVTRRASIKDKIQAFRAGADDYMVKPLTPALNFYGRMLLLRRAGHIARLAR